MRHTKLLLNQFKEQDGYNHNKEVQDDSKWYYKNQLSKLKDLTTVNIKLTDCDGNSTNSMDLNIESIEVLLELLKTMKKDLT